METRQIRFGQVRSIPKDVEESRTVEFVISDSSKDRHRTIIPLEGWELEAFNRNGIVGYQHNVYGAGLCEGPDPDMVIGKGSAFIEGSQLIGRSTFEPASINPLAEKIFRKVLFGSLTSTSVGFNELERGYFGKDDEAEGRENETYYFGKRELMEFSVVNIPSNRNAQVRGTMRDQTAGAISYVLRELGDRFRSHQILNFRVCDVLDLLDGKDVDINSTDPAKVRELLKDVEAKKATIKRLQEMIDYYQSRELKTVKLR